MSETNPYKPPAAQGANAAAADGDFNAEGRAVDAGRGWEWIASGFELFKKQPGIWILMVIILFVCMLLISIVPFIGWLAGALLFPVFIGGIMIGSRALEGGGNLEIAHLFAGFKQNTGDLVVVGLLQVIVGIVLIVPICFLVGGSAFFAVATGNLSGGLAGMGLVIFLAVLTQIAIGTVFSFAPALVVFHNLKPVEAIKASLFACIKNIAPIIVWLIIALILSIIASIPFLLGLLVMVPVALTSIYTSYRDIFFGA